MAARSSAEGLRNEGAVPLSCFLRQVVPAHRPTHQLAVQPSAEHDCVITVFSDLRRAEKSQAARAILDRRCLAAGSIRICRR